MKMSEFGKKKSPRSKDNSIFGKSIAVTAPKETKARFSVEVERKIVDNKPTLMYCFRENDYSMCCEPVEKEFTDVETFMKSLGEAIAAGAKKL